MSWKRKQFFQNQALPDFQSGYYRWVKCYNNNNNIEWTTRAWYGMEWNGNFGMEWNGTEISVWKMPEWNGMKDLKNGMEDNLPCLRTNSMLDFVHRICRKIHSDVGWL